jgi:hypothetical protein
MLKENVSEKKIPKTDFSTLREGKTGNLCVNSAKQMLQKGERQQSTLPFTP